MLLGGPFLSKPLPRFQAPQTKLSAAAPTPGFHQNVYTTRIHAKEGAQQNISGVFSERVGFASFFVFFLLTHIFKNVYNLFCNKIIKPQSHAKSNKAWPHFTS